MEHEDVIIVGAGVAGLTAALFTARADLSTRLINCGSSILNRNAHLENYPGFPEGIDPRLLLSLIREQVESEGAVIESAGVTNITATEPLKVCAEGTFEEAHRVILACWSDVDVASCPEVQCYQKNSKTFLETDERGETGLDGLYAAGRVAGVHHQTIVTAGDGARIGLNVIQDLDPDFYHDWVAPEGYFTDRGREVPRGCEEISKAERNKRAEKGRQAMMEFLREASPTDPTPHPTQMDDDSSEDEG